MRFLTTKEGDQFGVPAKVQASGVLLVVGLIFVYWGVTLSALAGRMGQVVSIGLGSLLIGIATILRTGPNFPRYIGFFFVATLYFLSILGITWVQDHYDWFYMRLIFYFFEVFAFFVCGYLLACERPAFNNSATHWIILPLAAVCMLTQLFFMRSLQASAELAMMRSSRSDLGSIETNPIALAFAAGCLAAVFLGLALSNRHILKRMVYLVAFAVITLTMLSAASRGAALWLACTVLFTLLLVRNQHYFSFKHKMVFLVVICAAIPAVVALYTFNPVIETKIDMLGNRFAVIFAEHQRTDGSSGRTAIWGSYLDDSGKWLVLGMKNYINCPHNIWLEVGVRFGMLGLPLLFIMIFTIVRLGFDAIIAKAPPDNEFVVVATVFVFAYLSNVTSLSITMNRGLFLGLGYFLGYYVSLRRRRFAEAMRSVGPAPQRML